MPHGLSDSRPDEGCSGTKTPEPSDASSRLLVLSYVTPQPSDNNPAAVWAMACVLSFIAVFLLGIQGMFPGILVLIAMVVMVGTAIVLGYIGMRPSGPPRGRKLAKAAFVLGWVLLSLFVLVGTILPQFGAAGRRTQRVQCSSYLRQIGQCLALYANNNNSLLPPDLGVLISSANLPAWCLVCPASDDTPATGSTTQAIALNAVTQKGHCSYVYIGVGLNQNSINPDHVLAYDITLKHHENEGMNVLYGDGHVDWLSKEAAIALIAELKSGHNPPRPPGDHSQGTGVNSDRWEILRGREPN